MNNAVSIVMLGLIAFICISFLLKGWKKPEISNKKQKVVATCFSGMAIGFIIGLLLGATSSHLFFTESFLKQEGAGYGVFAILSIGFSLVGAFAALILYGLLQKVKA
jgi:hypothetical protein